MESPFDIAADLDTPVSAYMKLKPFGPCFLLESVESGERLARYSFLDLGARLTLENVRQGSGRAQYHYDVQTPFVCFDREIEGARFTSLSGTRRC